MGLRIRGLTGLAGLLAVATLSAFASGVIGAAWISPSARVPHASPKEARRAVSGTSGTAFYVAPGVLVTNAHVTTRCRAAGAPISVAGREGEWDIRAEEREVDLALLVGRSMQGEVILPLSAGRWIPRGSDVLVAGFPLDPATGRPSAALRGALGQVLRSRLTVHPPGGDRATIFALRGRDGEEIEPSWEDGVAFFGADRAASMRWLVEIGVPTAAGGSGGPVLDAGGGVAGVVFAVGVGRATTAAVSLSDLREFLARADVTPAFVPPGSARISDPNGILGAAARAIVRVYC